MSSKALKSDQVNTLDDEISESTDAKRTIETAKCNWNSGFSLHSSGMLIVNLSGR